MNTLNNHNKAPRENGAGGAAAHDATHLPLAQFARTELLARRQGQRRNRPGGGQAHHRALPSIHTQACASRWFLCRVVRYLAHAHHIRQFIDIGLGFPFEDDNTHQVAQRVAPACEIVYADHDAVLLAHARALLTSHPEGVCDYVDADLREATKILVGAGQTLDLTQPVALLLFGALRHLPGDNEAAGVIGELTDALAPCSFVVISHLTNAVHGAASDQAWQYWNEHGTPRVVLRSPEQITRFFGGLELLKPGVVSCSRWRPGLDPSGLPAEVDEFCGVARKPGSPR